MKEEILEKKLKDFLYELEREGHDCRTAAALMYVISSYILEQNGIRVTEINTEQFQKVNPN